jgi:8-oxo-dGTP diphosphatase
MIPVVAVALCRKQGDKAQVLMQQRLLSRQHGGLWEFPGGKIDPGESASAAALRELAEELGIALDPADLAPISFAQGPQGGVLILLYACWRWNGEPALLDAAAMQWVDLDAIPALAMPPLDYPLADALIDALTKALPQHQQI